MDELLKVSRQSLIEMPTALYKFRSLSKKCFKDSSRNAFEDTMDIIENKRLWWSAAFALNDEFDCNPLPILKGSALKNEFLMRRTLRNVHPSLSKRDIGRLAREASLSPRDFEARMLKKFEEFRQEIGVCSLSARFDRDEMWEKYADEHRGICLRFKDIDDAAHFSMAFKVNYVETRPQIPIYESVGFERIKTFVLTKTDNWSYEDEWRLFDVSHVGHRDFPPRCLTGIILGADITDNDREMVIRSAVKSVSPINLFQARRASIGIEILPYNCG